MYAIRSYYALGGERFQHRLVETQRQVAVLCGSRQHRIHELVLGGNAPTHTERQGTETNFPAADANPGVLILKRNSGDGVAGIAGP